jgi:hypothetical protein
MPIRNLVEERIHLGAAGCLPTGRRSCFYRAVPLGKAPDGSLTLEFAEAQRTFDRAKVYGGRGEGTATC